MRLRSMGSGHTDLKLLISEQSSCRRKYKDLIASQTSSIRKLEKWSQSEENPAVQDVLHQVFEVNLLWMDAQREFVVALKEYKRVFERVLEMEKRLDQARKQLSLCEDKERKFQKELVKAKEPAITQEKLRQATDAKNLADAEVSGQQRETEAVKLMSLRAGLLDMSTAWEAMGKKCTILADSQRELAQLIPDVHSDRVQDVPSYAGARDSTRILYTARTQLDQMAPPPYTSSSSPMDYSSYQPQPPLARPFSAGQSVDRPRSSSASQLPQRRTSEDTTLTAKNFQLLNTLDNDFEDSFDSDSD